MPSRALLSALALLPAANCVAFGGPAPTATSPNRALNGMSPKPTKGPSVAELRRRQTNLDPETCGWVDGDFSSWVTCDIGRTCMLYTSADIGMAGCCDGNDYQSCGWATSCMDYDTYWSSSSCDTDCELNTFIRKCTGYGAPYCVTWTYPGDNVLDYGCAATSSFLIETVLQYATDSYDSSFTTSMSLPTVSGDAVAFDQSTSAATGVDTTFDLFPTGTESTDFEEATSLPNGGGGSRKKKTKIGISVIIGAVVGGLVLLFLIGAAVIFICVKQKKKKQLANNQQAIAAAQANHPQPQYQQPMQQQQPQGYASPIPPQTPQPMEGYFKPGMAPSPQPGYAQPVDQKYGQAQVNEYPVHSPVSNPTTPAPAYVQPYYAAQGTAPPVPAQSPGPYQNRGPTPGAHEVDAISAPQTQQSQGGNVYEIGGGK